MDGALACLLALLVFCLDSSRYVYAYSSRYVCAFPAAHEWLEKYAAIHPALKDALADDSIWKHAKKVKRLWLRTFEQRVYELRSSRAIMAQRNLSQLHRTATEMTRALVMHHATFSVFLSVRLSICSSSSEHASF